MPFTDLSAMLSFSGPVLPTVLVLLKATAILLGGLALTLALHRSSASTRYLVWLLAIGGLLALPAIATLSPVDVRILPAASAPAVQTISAPVQLNTPVQAGTEQEPAGPIASDGSALQSPVSNVAPGAISLGTALLAIWAGVASFLLARLLQGVFAVRRIVRRAEALTHPSWQEQLFEISDRLGIENAPALLLSRDIQMPFAAGIRRATIVLPAACEEWSPAQRDAVLIHELGHVRRRDMIGHTLGRVACAVYWFHPLVWTAARKLRDASERACDDLALRLGARPSEYAQHLLDIVTSVRQTHTPTAAIAMARRKEFEGRMLAILDPGLRRDAVSRWRTAALSGALAVFVFAVSAAAPAPRPAVVATDASPTGTSDPAESSGDPELAAQPGPAADRATTTDQPEQQEGVLPVVNQAMREAVPAFDRFIQDQARRINVNVNTTVNDTAVDPEKRDLLIRILRTDSAASVRKVAAWGLGRYAGDASAQTALANALQSDADGEVRTMSAWALAHASSPTALTALRNAWSRDRDADVRETAVWGLGTLGEASDADLIASRLASETSTEVRSTAAWAIGSLGARTAPRSLIALLDDPDSRTRLHAAWALSVIGDSNALPAIDRALKAHQDDRTTRALLRALVRSGAPTEAITGLMNSPNAEVRLTAIRSMTGGGLDFPWPWPWPRPIVWP